MGSDLNFQQRRTMGEQWGQEQWGQISTFNKNADIKEFEKMLKVEI